MSFIWDKLYPKVFVKLSQLYACVRSLQLWRDVVDGLVVESVKLRATLGLPEHNVWSDTTQEHNTCEYTHKVHYLDSMFRDRKF